MLRVHYSTSTTSIEFEVSLIVILFEIFYLNYLYPMVLKFKIIHFITLEQTHFDNHHDHQTQRS